MGTEKSRRAKQEYLEGYLRAAFKGNDKIEISLKKLLAAFSIKMLSREIIGKEILGAYAALGVIDIKEDVVTKGKRFNK